MQQDSSGVGEKEEKEEQRRKDPTAQVRSTKKTTMPRRQTFLHMKTQHNEERRRRRNQEAKGGRWKWGEGGEEEKGKQEERGPFPASLFFSFLSSPHSLPCYVLSLFRRLKSTRCSLGPLLTLALSFHVCRSCPIVRFCLFRVLSFPCPFLSLLPSVLLRCGSLLGYCTSSSSSDPCDSPAPPRRVFV